MSDELYHFGIPGMHWGQRNGPPYPLPTRIANKVKKSVHKVKRGINKERYRAKEISKMSDEEMLQRIGRLEQEKKLRKLEREQETALKGHEAIKEILSESGKKAAKTVAQGAMTQIGADFAERFISTGSGKIIKDLAKPKK